jgi:hypothetical protein
MDKKPDTHYDHQHQESNEQPKQLEAAESSSPYCEFLPTVPKIHRPMILPTPPKEPYATTVRNCTIFEKLGSPKRFRNAMMIPDGLLAQELDLLRKILLENRIQLLVSSPNISDAELYRFMTGEFMDLRIANDGSPLFHCFLYDDYHPDPFFDNEQTALNRCVRFILDKKLQADGSLFMEQFMINQYGLMLNHEAIQVINSFKDRYEEILILDLNAGKTSIRGKFCEVSGSHATGFIRGNKCLLRTGRWQVEFQLTVDSKWKIYSVRIEDVDL